MIIPPAVYRAEVEAARGLGLPVTVHASGPRSAVGQIGAIAREELLGPDLQVVHGVNATGEEITQLSASGASLSLSPVTELLIGYGLPPTGEFLGAGIPMGLSVDTTELSGNADMFGIMKVMQAAENARTRSEFALTSRRVLELATIDGARSMGLGRRRVAASGEARGHHHGLAGRAEPGRLYRPGALAGHCGDAGGCRHGDRGRAGAEARRAAYSAGSSGDPAGGAGVARCAAQPGLDLACPAV